MNKCMIKSPTVLFFPTITGEDCCLHFGYNTKFEYYKKGNMVTLKRKNMSFTISEKEFEKMFKII